MSSCRGGRRYRLGGGDAGGGVVVHLSHVVIPNVADIGGLVKAVCGEVDAVKAGGVRDLEEMRGRRQFSHAIRIGFA